MDVIVGIDSSKLLFLDCQTTDMHPSMGQILELAWISPLSGPRSFLLRLPEGDELSHKVSEITGITDADLIASAVDEETALAALEADLAALGEGAVIVAHYAQFEKAFLADMFKIRRGKDELPFPTLCTFKIARLLYPEIPSRNIRALVGYFSLGDSEIKRASAHAAATAAIWNRLKEDLTKVGIETFPQLGEWLEKTKGKKPAKIEYRMDRFKRLDFPNRPGIYRMISQGGQVLYVGKATSLKSRVNSYFRGQKGRDRKKLEMLAQVWDIQVQECASALEAALLENEEIKRLNPPYNVSLKVGRRKLVFFSRDFLSSGSSQDAEYPLGPFPRSNAIELLREWLDGISTNEFAQVFYEPIPEDVLRSGYLIFCERNGLDRTKSHSIRELLTLGMKELRTQLKLEALKFDQEEAEEEEAPPENGAEDEKVENIPRTPEEIAGFYAGLLMRAAAELRRARRLTRMLNVRVAMGKRVLELRAGRVWHSGDPLPKAEGRPWKGLDIVDYDRMAVLLSEVNRNSYPVESLPATW